MSRLVSFDVFSALIDSRTGGSAFFAGLGNARSWPCTPGAVYDRWDAHNKLLQLRCTRWRSFAELAEEALSTTYRDMNLTGSARQDSARLLAGMSTWPLWPDVSAEALSRVNGGRLGLLTNIDDGLLEPTAVMRLGVFDPQYVITSQSVRAYKPSAEFYRRGVERMGPLLHVASSSRDVRGALEAGIACVRMDRPGHSVDPAGPQPRVVVGSVLELPGVVSANP